MIRSIPFLLLLLLLACNNKNNSIDSPTETTETLVVYLVRHAEKANDGTNDPPLNPQGINRAKRLKEMLETEGVERIYATPYKRTRETAQALSAELGLEIISYTPHDSTFVPEVLLKSTQDALVVGHSNTIPDLVNQLIGKAKYEQLGEMEYDKLFKVEIKGEQTQEALITY